MELDARMILTLAGMLVSVVSAAAIVRQKLATVIDQLQDTEVRLRGLDRRIDALDTSAEKQEQRINILAQMSSPENLRRDHMTMATLLRDCEQLRKEMDHQLHIHNGKHVPVSDVRKAE
jgi:hypothetical protein|tara:strand:- start:63 stop:419 length:357 start_codon:yes stop_codon:yes gene_type:complete